MLHGREKRLATQAYLAYCRLQALGNTTKNANHQIVRKLWNQMNSERLDELVKSRTPLSVINEREREAI